MTLDAQKNIHLPDASSAPVMPGCLPWLGHTFRMLPDALAFLVKGYQEYGSVYRFSIPGRKYVALAGPKANELLQQREHEYFSSALTYPLLLRESCTSHYLNAMDGSEHLSYRRQVVPLMDANIPEAWRTEIASIVQETSERWVQAGRIRVLEEMQRLFLDVFGLVASGERAGQHMDAFDLFIRTFITAGAGIKPAWFLKLPKYIRAKKQLKSYLINRFEANVEGRTWLKRIHALRLAGGEAAGNNEKIVLAMLPYLNSLLYVGRTATTLLFALLQNQAEMHRLSKEGSEEGSNPLWKGAIYEAIRLVPMAISHPRIVKKSFTFEGYRFKPGTSVMMAVCVTHQLPEYFPEPEKFQPSRFSESTGKAYRPPIFAGFGLGPHACMGREWVERIIPAVMATLLSNLQFQIDPPHFKWKLDFDPVPGPPADFTVSIKRYSSNLSGC